MGPKSSQQVKLFAAFGFFGPRPDGILDGFGCDMPKDALHMYSTPKMEKTDPNAAILEGKGTC